MAITLSIEPEREPLRQGSPRVLTLRVTNPGPAFLALERATSDGPRDGEVRWRRPPEGLIVYDALADCYLHSTSAASRAAVPLCNGMVRPGGFIETFLPVKALAPGERTVEVVVTGALIPAEELGRRVYVAPDRFQGAEVRYEPATDPAQARGNVIVRTGGCEAVRATTTVVLSVLPEPGAADALTRAGPGATVVDRLRRLGGAWLVRAADGALHLIQGERAIRCPPGRVSEEALAQLDRGRPTDPLLIQFRGEQAARLRELGALPLEGGERAQQLLPPAAVWDLLEAVVRRGLRLTAGPHAAISEGLIVSD